MVIVMNTSSAPTAVGYDAGMDVASFRDKSRSVWDAMAHGWDEHRRIIADAGRPVVEALVEALSPERGQTILELAGGTGEVGLAVAAVVGDEGRVMVTDFAPEMVGVARRGGAALGLRNVDYLILDAEEMTLPTASVDGVICRWGYMLMPRPGRALAETRRVLRPGGRLAFAVFAEPARNPWAALASGVLVERAQMTRPAPGTPGIFALHDAAALARLVRDAGFTRVDVREVPHLWRFPDADSYWEFLTQVAGAISMVLQQLDASARAAVRHEIEARLGAYRRDEGYALAAVSLCVLAA
jgi:ubiquinone/menaquinone biosynthesis C-methylase UbiE